MEECILIREVQEYNKKPYSAFEIRESLGTVDGKWAVVSVVHKRGSFVVMQQYRVAGITNCTGINPGALESSVVDVVPTDKMARYVAYRTAMDIAIKRADERRINRKVRTELINPVDASSLVSSHISLPSHFLKFVS